MGVKPHHFPIGTRYLVSLLVGCLILAGCAVYQTESISKIALLTSFEGRYREIGYNALYAAQLALQENNITNIDLLAIDDGGSIESAVSRAQALRHDPAVRITLVMGIYATDETVQKAFDAMPVLIVGHWDTAPVGQNAFMLASRELDDFVTLDANFEITNTSNLTTPVVGSEILTLTQIPKLHNSLNQITVISSGSLPSEDFRQRYLRLGKFTPEPGLLATLTYDAVGLAVQSVKTGTPISNITYSGINGTIHFENEYWQDAPIHHFQFMGAILTPVN